MLTFISKSYTKTHIVICFNNYNTSVCVCVFAIGALQRFHAQCEISQSTHVTKVVEPTPSLTAILWKTLRKGLIDFYLTPDLLCAIFST